MRPPDLLPSHWLRRISPVPKPNATSYFEVYQADEYKGVIFSTTPGHWAAEVESGGIGGLTKRRAIQVLLDRDAWIEEANR